jgi:hypothetical protein
MPKKGYYPTPISSGGKESTWKRSTGIDRVKVVKGKGGPSIGNRLLGFGMPSEGKGYWDEMPFGNGLPAL